MNPDDARSLDASVRPITHELTPDEIDARLRWARRQGYIAWFWPDVEVGAWRACLQEIERVTGVLLAADRAIEPYAALPDPAGRASATTALVTPQGADARALGIAAFTSGMGPLLGYWIEQDQLTADAALSSLLAEHLDHSRRRASRMHAARQRALDVLGSIGLKPILVKAAHTGTSLFAEAGLRPAADIDLVVDRTRFAAAEVALASAGYVLAKRRRNPRKSDWIPPGAPRRLRSLDVTHADNPFTLELHGSLDREFYGVRTVRFSSIGHLAVEGASELHPSARVLTQPLLTAYLAAHASEELHQLQLIRLVELVLLVRRDSASGALDWRELNALLVNRAAHRFTYPAFDLAERLVPGTIDAWFRRQLSRHASERMQAVVARIGPGTAQRLDELSLDERFLWTEGPFEAVRRFLHLLAPPRDGQSIMRHWTDRLTRLIRGRVSVRRDDRIV
ncbi:MAG: nucleotidyltransferase family protein [Longimicrobiales bacterium]